MSKVKFPPYVPPKLTESEILAIRALQTGTANEAQQKNALDVIINKICRTYDLAYYPGGEDGKRDSDFISGKIFCGQQIVKALNINLDKLT